MLGSKKYQKLVVESQSGHRITVSMADTWLKRLRGYKSKLASTGVHGVLIYPCSAIHTFGMKFDIDVYFLDENMKVVHNYPAVRSRRCKCVPRAKYVLELKSGVTNYPFADIGEQLGLTGYRC